MSSMLFLWERPFTIASTLPPLCPFLFGKRYTFPNSPRFVSNFSIHSNSENLDLYSTSLSAEIFRTEDFTQDSETLLNFDAFGNNYDFRNKTHQGQSISPRSETPKRKYRYVTKSLKKKGKRNIVENILLVLIVVPIVVSSITYCILSRYYRYIIIIIIIIPISPSPFRPCV